MRILETVEQRAQQEISSKNARLSDQVEHLKRRLALLDIQMRGHSERDHRILRNRIFNLELQVSQLRLKMKGLP